MVAASQRRRALVVGATGIVGQNLGTRLAPTAGRCTGCPAAAARPARGVRADPRRPRRRRPGWPRRSMDWRRIWSRSLPGPGRPTEAENIAVNGAAVRNVLAAVEAAGSVAHVALMTGLKHYLGPFEAYAQGVMADTPFHEDEPRLDAPNFYYAQEDELFEAARRCGFTWSVHRSHTVFGFAVGNAMNMVLTIAAYATICRELGRPFVFPGSATQWNSVTDVTDADLLADQIIWAPTNEAGHNEPFNTANGDVFRWRWLWPQIAAHFGLEWEGFAGAPRTLVDVDGRHGGRLEGHRHQATASSSRTWTGSRPGGTPTATSAARSRFSPT